MGYTEQSQKIIDIQKRLNEDQDYSLLNKDLYHGAQKRQFQLAIKMADRILYYLSSGSERYIFSIKQGRDIYYMLEAQAFSNPDTYISHVDSKLKGLRPLYSHQHSGNKVAVQQMLLRYMIQSKTNSAFSLLSSIISSYPL